MVHEFTHAVTEHIASYYRAMGYDTRSDVLAAMRSEVYKNQGHEEPKWDNRKWSSRPEEFLSRNMEGLADTKTARDTTTQEVRATIKKWYRRVQKLPSKRPKPETAHITLW